jgi:DNA-binding XRE family transcriptional regulator
MNQKTNAKCKRLYGLSPFPLTIVVDYGNLTIMKPEELYTWRKQRGLTQLELGKLLGVTKACISRWESGERPMPHLLTLALRCLQVRKGGEGEKVEGKRKRKRKEGEYGTRNLQKK